MAEKKELAVILKEHAGELKALAPKYLNTNRMMAIFIEATNNPRLRQCTPVSVLASAKKMAELGTEIVGSGGVHLVPFADQMTVIPDWRLIVQKARGAGVIKHATATVVHAGDAFEYEKGLEPKLTHRPARKEKAEMTDVYCVYTLPDGTKDFEVMRKKEVDAVRKRSKAANAGPWVTDYEEMAKKTVIRRALKVFEGASPELSMVIDADNAAVGFEEFTLEPIAEPKALPEKGVPVIPEPAKSSAEQGQGKENNPPEIPNPQPPKENAPETKEKRGPGRPKNQPGEIDYALFLDNVGMRKGETTEIKPCANPKCPQGKGNQPVGKITGLCIVCLRELSGKSS